MILNANMAHLVNDPERMFNEMERVLRSNGFLFMIDLRRSSLGILESEIFTALSGQEARELIHRSRLRQGHFSAGLISWRYESIPHPSPRGPGPS